MAKCVDVGVDPGGHAPVANCTTAINTARESLPVFFDLPREEMGEHPFVLLRGHESFYVTAGAGVTLHHGGNMQPRVFGVARSI